MVLTSTEGLGSRMMEALWSGMQLNSQEGTEEGKLPLTDYFKEPYFTYMCLCEWVCACVCSCLTILWNWNGRCLGVTGLDLLGTEL